MATGSDNPFPSILLQEHVDPATPPSGHWRLFVDTDNILKIIDDAGTVSAVGAGGGTTVATDTIWDAAGDLVQGTGANTSAKLSAGTAGKVLTSNGASAALTWETPSAGSAGALTLLDTQTLGSSAAGITSSGISGSYKDLLIVGKLRGTTSANTVDSWIRVGNSTVDTGSNYSDQTSFSGTSSGTVATDSATKVYLGAATAASTTSGVFSSFRIEILDYAATSTPRFITGSAMHAAAGRFATVINGMWRDVSSAINIVTVFPDTNNFLTGSRIYVYGRG